MGERGVCSVRDGVDDGPETGESCGQVCTRLDLVQQLAAHVSHDGCHGGDPGRDAGPDVVHGDGGLGPDGRFGACKVLEVVWERADGCGSPWCGGEDGLCACVKDVGVDLGFKESEEGGEGRVDVAKHGVRETERVVDEEGDACQAGKDCV